MSRRPLPLIGALVTTTLVVSAALGWLAWRLIDQQDAIDQERARGQLERTADAISARIGERFAAAGERLTSLAAGESPAPGPAGTATVTITAAGSIVAPQGALPFVPFIRPVAPVVSRPLDEAEAAELRDDERPRALAAYRALARDTSPQVRTVALMRLAAMQRKARDLRGAFESYRALTLLDDVQADHLPAGLVGLYGQHAILRELGDEAGRSAAAEQLSEKLDRGTWMLTRGTAELYRDGLPRVKPASWRLAAALDDFWREHSDRLPARGQQIFSGESSPVLVLWRSGESRVVLLAAPVDIFLEDVLPASSGWQLAAPGGHVLAANGEPPARAVSHVVALPDFPLTLKLWDRDPIAGGGWRKIQLAALTAVLVFLWGTTWLMARAIRREARVARLQSDFVAAVSHEFRSPATTIRQMAEMLALGRVRDDARQQEYYAMLMSEASRLQRLVETLLDFGRMEAGAERYTMADVPVSSIVERVQSELQPQLQETPGRLDIDGPRGVDVRGDEAALVLALRNLVDNALKYSPPQLPISIRWQHTGGRVELSVRDRGGGVPLSEQRVIFDRFVRGRDAITGSIRGTGLGLAMVQRIASAHGGQVRLESEPGRGSTFTLTLPASAAGREEVAAATPVQQV